MRRPLSPGYYLPPPLLAIPQRYLPPAALPLLALVEDLPQRYLPPAALLHTQWLNLGLDRGL